MKRPSLVSIALAAALFALLATGCTSTAASPAPATTTAPAETAAPNFPAGLKVVDEVVGTGATAKTGDHVTVNYTGWLTDGTKFDSSLDRNQPFEFDLGAGRVIKGWDEGVVGMKVGGKRKLTISPDLGYGAQGAGGAIPPGATLVFEIELLKVN